MEARSTASSPGAGDTGARELRQMGCGRPLGRYTLLRRLAAGGMAEVYVARSPGISGFEKKVAVKKILPQHSHNERFVDMLVDEAKITVSLTHPNIAQVYELGLAGEDYFIVMEYVMGRPLNRLMQRVDDHGLDSIPIEHAVYVMGEVAKGLDHAHKQKDQRGRPLGIVHRDVSPQNVLISYQGDVKLIDFGIARAEGRLNQTSVGVIKGKLRYLAPEIAAGEEPDHRADVYCCGIVLFEMLTGEAMFAPKNDLEAIEIAAEAKVKSPRARNPRVPEELDEIVMRALVRDRSRRYQSAKELAADLRRFLNQRYPAYVGSELGDFMQQMFAQEITADQSLDELAERLSTDRSSFEGDDETLAAGSLATLAAEQGERGYRQLVTRLSIGERGGGAVRVAGADGGRSMLVVPATADALPLRGGAESRSAHLRDTPGAGLAAEPTVRAENPFLVDGAQSVTGESVAAEGPGPRFVDPAARPPAPRARGAEEREAMLGRAPSRAHDVVTEPGRRRASSRLRWAFVAAAALLFAASGTAFWLLAARRAPPVEISAERGGQAVAGVETDEDPRAGREPPLPAATAGALRLEITPEVPVTVVVGDRERVSRQRPPVELGDLEPDVVHRLQIRADGYRTEELSRSVRAGEQKTVTVELEAAMGLIELRGAEDAVVRASAGKVEGARVVDVPLDTVVDLEVQRPGAPVFTRSVHVTSTDRVVVAVPAARARAPGTLVVNTRPVSVVYVDGKRRGSTPLKLQLPPGRHKVVVESPSGERQSFTATVNAAKVTTIVRQWP
jgi:serine/threonine protein kinase